MADERFKVQTTKGELVSKGKDGKGLDEKDAVARAKECDNRAVVLGIVARYEAVKV